MSCACSLEEEVFLLNSEPGLMILGQFHDVVGELSRYLFLRVPEVEAGGSLFVH